MQEYRQYRWVDLDGQDTRGLGIKVLRLPPVSIAEERVLEQVIPGREEPFIERLGEYYPMVKAVECFYDGTDPAGVAQALAGVTTARFSNDQRFVVDCAVIEQHELTRVLATWHKFYLRLRCQPLKREYDPEDLTGLEVELANEGSVTARPVITLEVDGPETVTLSAGASSVTLADVSGTVVVDAWRRVVHDGAGTNLSHKMTGAFPAIPAGETVTITADGAAAMLVQKNLRWR